MLQGWHLEVVFLAEVTDNQCPATLSPHTHTPGPQSLPLTLYVLGTSPRSHSRAATEPGLESRALCSPASQRDLLRQCQRELEELPEPGPLCLDLPLPLAAGFPVLPGVLPDLP